MLSAKEQEILTALERPAEHEGVEIVTIEIVGAKKAPTIRVYIDTEEGVSFDELSSAQKWINEVVDELDPFPGAYMLEVSSPGIDRPLRTVDHFRKYEGDEANIVLKEPVNGRAKYAGVLKGLKEGSVLLECDGELHSFELSTIKRARLKGSVQF